MTGGENLRSAPARRSSACSWCGWRAQTGDCCRIGADWPDAAPIPGEIGVGTVVGAAPFGTESMMTKYTGERFGRRVGDRLFSSALVVLRAWLEAECASLFHGEVVLVEAKRLPRGVAEARVAALHGKGLGGWLIGGGRCLCPACRRRFAGRGDRLTVGVEAELGGDAGGGRGCKWSRRRLSFLRLLAGCAEGCWARFQTRIVSARFTAPTVPGGPFGGGWNEMGGVTQVPACWRVLGVGVILGRALKAVETLGASRLHSWARWSTCWTGSAWISFWRCVAR